MTERIELLNKDKIWTLGEKKNLQILLEADTIKHAEMKEKKNTSGERENYSKPNYIAEISSKG